MKAKIATTITLLLSVFLSVLPATSQASYIVSTSGLSTQSLLPSADTLTLAGNTTTTSLGNFALQLGTFYTGDSGYLSGTYTYTFNELVTINGDTETVPVSVSLVVTNPNQANQDTLSILLSSTATFFSSANVDLIIQPLSTVGLYLGQSLQFDLIADLEEHVPEPGNLALVGLGLGALLVSRRRKQ